MYKTIVVGVVVCCIGIAYVLLSKDDRLEYAEKYILEAPSTDIAIQEAIRRGEVVVGMSVHEAFAACGRCIYEISGGSGSPPSLEELAHRTPWGDWEMRLYLSNKTQFKTWMRVSFCVVIQDGRVVAIKPNP